MDVKKYNEDDYCDIYSKKICDNCGDCLKEQGIDVRAIKIEDIAKTVEENEFLENEYKKMVELNKSEEIKDEVKATFDEYSLEEEGSDYVDAFENIVYIDDLEMSEEESFDELTEEIFPGVRKLKGNY